ncbi:MAG: class I SAM-dependent RNA methyltransferase [Deltaproteobacteria bacterium]|nr:class I SAM-dependent RNA methyltransferase [Deltaproteobacteria bacterium]
MTGIERKKGRQIKIEALAYGPHGVGRSEGRVILIPLTAPGDEAEFRIVADRGNYAVGELTRLITPSVFRQSPPCPYFSQCGGCPWQHVRYENQLAAKQKVVDDALRRIGKLHDFELLPILPSPREFQYRGRIRLQIDDRKRLGFHRAFSHDLIEITSCPIAESSVERHLEQAREWLRDLRTPIQQIEIVHGDEPAGAVLAAKARGGFAPEDDVASSAFLERNERIKGLIIFGRGWRRSWGEGKITLYSEGGLRAEIDGEVFTQVNRLANREMIREVLRWGEFHSGDRILELYSGAGNFTLPMAKRCGAVTAVESNSAAVANGQYNSRLNRIENVTWIRSDVLTAVKKLAGRGEQFTRVLLNPPRAGAKGVEEVLPAFSAEKILYVSCNPATLARDLAALSAKNYKITRVRPADLFPHTFHVEVLAEMVVEGRPLI